MSRMLTKCQMCQLRRHGKVYKRQYIDSSVPDLEALLVTLSAPLADSAMREFHRGTLANLQQWFNLTTSTIHFGTTALLTFFCKCW